MKVNFLLIGAAKSATTSLSIALSQHPDICFSSPKEPDFFNRPDWRSQIEDYHSLFKSETKIYGEGSTNYSKFPDYNVNIHNDIYEYNPSMKLIYIMRHPVDRLISYYTHAFNRGHETENSIDLVLTTNNHYINTGKYAMQIEPYIKLFGRANVLLLFYEDFAKNPQTSVEKVFEFLNLNSISLDTKGLKANKSFNRRVLHHKYDNPKTFWDKLKKTILILKNQYNPDFLEAHPKIKETTREFIIEACREDIKKIEALANRDLSHWLI